MSPNINETYELFSHQGRSFAYRVEPDICTGAPWDVEEGHGPVSDWERRAKRPGELVLCEDRGLRRLYDFAEACRLARQDGWGWLPEPLRTVQVGGVWHSFISDSAQSRIFEGVSHDINCAIRETYLQHRATMSAREYAAEAARRDFARLRDWCAGYWGWCGIVVAPIDAYGPDWRRSESLWGIEDDSPDYHSEVAVELAACLNE